MQSQSTQMEEMEMEMERKESRSLIAVGILTANRDAINVKEFTAICQCLLVQLAATNQRNEPMN